MANNLESDKPWFDGLDCEPHDGRTTDLSGINIYELFARVSFSLSPVMIVVNGVEIEDGYRGSDPETSTDYYLPNPNSSAYYVSTHWADCEHDQHALRKGRIYFDKDKAIARGKLEASGTPF